MRFLEKAFVMMLFCFTYETLSADFDLRVVKLAIQEKGAKWSAEENWVTRLSFEEQKQLCGDRAIIPQDARFLTLPHHQDLPKKFDWRENNGNWITSVKNQNSPQGCGSCWDFAAIAQVESWWKIVNNQPDSMIDLSEQFILSCANAGSCAEGGDSGLALSFVRQLGVPLESCFPYQAKDGVSCQSACPNWEEQTIRIPDWSYINLNSDQIENIKTAIMKHPVITSYLVYQDFSSYSGGVYEHVWGDTLAGHGILIVGWNDDEKSWICKNSWGEEWGDNGFFRIKWGECNFGDYVAHIWDSVNDDKTLVANPKQVDITLTAGESVQESIELINFGQLPMEYFAQDLNFLNKNCFQPDTFNAFDGLSWWCHDENIGGYTDWWLQQLDLPIIDLSSSVQPKLNFMGYWALEKPEGIPAYLGDIDGWDGCNVMISIDGGKSFNVLIPNYPKYNCLNMYSYAIMSTDWESGDKIGGWGGNSDGWIPVEFNLSSFKTDKALIRFTFAADGGYSTPNDRSLIGFFIDDITINDGGNILFQNFGERDDSITGQGLAGFSAPEADWLELGSSAGVIPYGAFIDFPIYIYTSHLLPGNYSTLIFFIANTNDLKFEPLVEKLTINLNVLAAEKDVKIVSHCADEFPLCIPILMNCVVTNIGKQHVNNCQIALRIDNNFGTVYHETEMIPQLLAGESKDVSFAPFCATSISDYELMIQTNNLGGDDNPQNNTIKRPIKSINMIDNFEHDTHLWDCQGGWGIPNEIIGHNSIGCMHVNRGAKYKDNMDAALTLKPGLEVRGASKSVIKYWVRSSTYDSDLCYIELSPDNTSWIKVDSIFGSFAWEQREIDLTPTITQGCDQIGFRYHFVSDSTKTRGGIYLDDIEIFTDFETDIDDENLNILPANIVLSQNFPNPFNQQTTIKYQLPKAMHLTMTIYDVLGNTITILKDQVQPAGSYSIPWDGKNSRGTVVSSGAYFCRMKTESFDQTRKILLIR